MVYVTFPDARTAKKIARNIVEARLASCANIFPPMRSIYHWKGHIEDGREVAVLMKTTKARYPALAKAIAAQHPYECPCVVTWPIGGWTPFLDWIHAETQPRKGSRRATAASRSA